MNSHILWVYEKNMNHKNTEQFDYICKLCNYETKYRQNFNKHCTTNKHIERANKSKSFICVICERRYKYKSGLLRHQKQCGLEVSMGKSDINVDSCNDIDTINTQDFKTMFYQVMNENRKLQNKLIEMANEPKIINKYQTITRNKNLNIINILNTNYKDAFNLSEFIQNFKISYYDLNYIKKYGYFQGMKDSLVKSLSELAQDKRPIHCMDIKRKLFYIKNNDEWGKDLTCDELNLAINNFNHEQLRKVLELMKNNPDEAKIQDTLNVITKEITTMYQEQGNKLRHKILNEIGNATFYKQLNQ